MLTTSPIVNPRLVHLPDKSLGSSTLAYPANMTQNSDFASTKIKSVVDSDHEVCATTAISQHSRHAGVSVLEKQYSCNQRALLSLEPLDQRLDQAHDGQRQQDSSRATPYQETLSPIKEIRTRSQSHFECESDMNIPFDEEETVEDRNKSFMNVAATGSLLLHSSNNVEGSYIVPPNRRNCNSDLVTSGLSLALSRLSTPLDRQLLNTCSNHKARSGEADAQLDSFGTLSSTLNRHQPEDDDSLFDFQEGQKSAIFTAAHRPVKHSEGSNKSSKSLSTSISLHRQHHDNDDTGSENEQGNLSPKYLRERSQAAWKRKTILHSKRPTLIATVPSPDSVDIGASSAISFAKIIVPSQHLHNDNADEAEDATLGGNSLNSEYTKSMESEVEDAFKDIFMIGSGTYTQPGRRKVKCNPNARERLRTCVEEGGNDTYENNTLATCNDDNWDDSFTVKRNLTSPPKHSPKRTSELDHNNPLLEALGVVESSLNAFGAVLGFDVGTKTTETIKAKALNTSASNARHDAVTGFQNLLEFASDVLLGSPSTETPLSIVDQDSAKAVTFSAPLLENDRRLVDLALETALSWHRMKGHTVDSAYELNIVDDIKFIVVDLKLPLGLVFQENAGGCWVAKVLSSGTTNTSRSVTVGDQLAAIDGASVIKMKVNEIASIIGEKRFETVLTFLRYIGPVRSAPSYTKDIEGCNIAPKPLASIVDTGWRFQTTRAGSVIKSNKLDEAVEENETTEKKSFVLFS
jgi:hypothetical protein